MELHIWGPAFGLPSIDAECNAAVAYLSQISKVHGLHWVLVANHDLSVTSNRDFPALVDGTTSVSGFTDIVHYLSNHPEGPYSLDSQLSAQQLADSTAYLTFIQLHSLPLIDLSLYATYENYYATTRPAFNTLLPWHVNYVVPPSRRSAAKERTAYLGLTSLHIGEDDDQRGQNKPSEQYDAAKKAAGLDNPAAARPSLLPIPQSAKMKQALRDARISDRFKLDSLTSALFDPLDDILQACSKSGRHFLLSKDKATSVDCLAFGYLSLMLYPKVPQPWLVETIKSNYPKVYEYIKHLRNVTVGSHDIDAEHVLKGPAERKDQLPWKLLAPKPAVNEAQSIASNLLELLPLPFAQNSVVNADAAIASTTTANIEKLTLSLPAKLLTISATMASAFAAFAFYHVRNIPKGSRYYSFEADRSHHRPTFADFGEAGAALAVLGEQIRFETQIRKERELPDTAQIAEVDIEIETTDR